MVSFKNVLSFMESTGSSINSSSSSESIDSVSTSISSSIPSRTAAIPPIYNDFVVANYSVKSTDHLALFSLTVAESISSNCFMISSVNHSSNIRLRKSFAGLFTNTFSAWLEPVGSVWILFSSRRARRAWPLKSITAGFFSTKEER